MIHYKPIRVVEPLPLDQILVKPRSARACEEPGCRRATRHKKPFCADHNHLNPHAAKVLSDLVRGVPALENAEMWGLLDSWGLA